MSTRRFRVTGVSTIPSWVSSITPGQLATYTGGGAVLTNHFRDAVDTSLYQAFYSVKIVNDYCGAAKNPYYGAYGATMFFGGGHSATNDNSTIVLEYLSGTMRFKRICNPSNWNYPGGVNPRDITNITAGVDYDATWGEYIVDGKPVSIHSYDTLAVVGPADGGGAYGTLYSPTKLAGLVQSFQTQAAHKLPVTSTSEVPNTLAWSRASTTAGAAAISDAPVGFSAFVPAQRRIYIVYHSDNLRPVRWLDTQTEQYVIGSGQGFNMSTAVVSGGDCYGTLVAVPERNLLLFIHRHSTTGALTVQYMDVSVAQPTYGGTAGLSQSLTLQTPWSTATWCPDNNRLIVAGIADDLGAVYEVEIPSTLSSSWTVTRAPLGGGQTIDNNAAGGVANNFNKFEYDRTAKAIVWFPLARRADQGADQVYVYRPRNT